MLRGVSQRAQIDLHFGTLRRPDSFIVKEQLLTVGQRLDRRYIYVIDRHALV
jgi:hypothetical protein